MARLRQAAQRQLQPWRPAIPGEPISLLLKESVIVGLQKDGGLENMEVQGTIALQVRPLVWPSPFLSLQPRFLPFSGEEHRGEQCALADQRCMHTQ